MDNMTDQDLDRLLGHATTPAPPAGAAARVAARAMGGELNSNVISLAQKRTSSRQSIAWLAALPLAASLAAGIYIGAVGAGNYFLPESLGGGAVAEEDTVLSGVEDMEDFADEDVS